MDTAFEQVLVDIARLRRELRVFTTLFHPLSSAPNGKDAALITLYLGIASLASTGVAACAEGDLYAARALTRSLADHWVRFTSIAAGSAPTDFFVDVKQAEAIDIDRRMRNCLPSGQIPVDTPAHVRALIRDALLEPEPSPADRARAKQIGQQFGFPELFKGLLDRLKAHDGQDDAASYATMAYAYSRFSACVHGGPLGRDYLTPSPSAHAIASTACDLFMPWTSALTLLLAMQRGPRSQEAREALAAQHAFLGWATGPRGPLGGLPVV